MFDVVFVEIGYEGWFFEDFVDLFDGFGNNGVGVEYGWYVEVVFGVF